MKRKNQNIYIGTIIRSLIIFIFLLLIITKNSDMLSKLMIFPFLLCSLFSVGKNICLLKDKNNIANVFSKLFIISFLTFWFGLLGYGSYLFIKVNNYFNLVFTLPFWIGGIYIIRKFLFGISSKSVPKNKKLKFNFQIIISGLLVASVLIIGVVCLFFGIHDTYKLNAKIKGYLTTEGYFTDYEVYDTDKDGTTYRHIYTYKVDGKEYVVKTDFGLGYIPAENSVREVKYNPDNQKESVLVGTNKNNFLIYFGAFFFLGGSVFVLGALYVKGVFDKVKIDVIGTYVGIVFFIVGLGIIFFQSSTTGSLLETIKSFSFWILIPIMFISVGIFQTIKCLFFKQKKK